MRTRKTEFLCAVDGRLPVDFPLTPAGNGQYRKRWAGKEYRFGPVSCGWKAALNRYNHDWPYILAGKVPPLILADGQDDPSTASFIANKFIEREAAGAGRGQITQGSFIDKRQAIEIAVTHLRPTCRLATLSSEDFAELRFALSRRWRKVPLDPAKPHGDYAWVKIEAEAASLSVCKRRIIHLREMLGWAYPKYLSRPIDFGDEFDLVSERDVRKAKFGRATLIGDKRWEVADIHSILGAIGNLSDVQLRAQFLLSILFGWTAVDCAYLSESFIDFKKHLIRYPRIKTGVPRANYMLPLIESALAAALAARPATINGGEVVHQYRDEHGHPVGEPIRLSDLVFRTKRGGPWVRRFVKFDANGLAVRESHVDQLAQKFDAIVRTIGVKKSGDGRGFGTGRHTTESHALRVADKALVDFWMGHANGNISGWYDHPPIEDMRRLAENLERRLLPDVEQPAESGAAASARTRMRIVG